MEIHPFFTSMIIGGRVKFTPFFSLEGVPGLWKDDIVAVGEGQGETLKLSEEKKHETVMTLMKFNDK